MPQKFSQVLPKNWDGRFPFTNPTDEEFVFIWGKKAYLFPANSTVDMMRMNFNSTPLEVMSIRKKAAQKLGEREFFKSGKYESLRAREGTKDENGVIVARLGSFQTAGSYTVDEMTSWIQKCLTPMPEVEAMVAPVETRETIKELHRDDDDNFISKVVKKDTGSLDQPTTFAVPDVLVN